MAIGCAVSIQQGGSFSEYMMRSGVVAGAQIALKGPQFIGFALDEGPVATELAAARLELSYYEAMPLEGAEEASQAEYLAALADWEKRQATKADLRARYEYALAQVHAWTPPGELFEAFKSERIHELEQSIACDCGFQRDQAPVRLTGMQWRVQKIAGIERVIEHLHMTSVRYKFIQALKKSLGLTEQA